MSGHRHLARVRVQTIQELLLESCPTFRRRRPGAAPAATICSRSAGLKQQLEASTRKSALRGGDTASARYNEVRRSSGHDRVNCRLGTRTVDAFQHYRGCSLAC